LTNAAVCKVMVWWQWRAEVGDARGDCLIVCPLRNSNLE